MTALPVGGSQPSRPRLPPLVNGDRLSRHEFERRYEASPSTVRAELIEGVVFMASPVSETWHGLPHMYVGAWLATYHSETPGTLVGDNSTVQLDLDNEPQPDAYIRIASEAGGRTTTTEKGYVAGAPEFVAEIAGSSAAIDLHSKLTAYRRNGVREYLVIRTYDEAIDWFVLRGSDYERLVPTESVVKSETFPGLWLDGGALLKRDLATVLKVLQSGIGSLEHQAFARQLAQNGSRAQ